MNVSEPQAGCRVRSHRNSLQDILTDANILLSVTGTHTARRRKKINANPYESSQSLYLLQPGTRSVTGTSSTWFLRPTHQDVPTTRRPNTTSHPACRIRENPRLIMSCAFFIFLGTKGASPFLCCRGHVPKSTEVCKFWLQEV